MYTDATSQTAIPSNRSGSPAGPLGLGIGSILSSDIASSGSWLGRLGLLFLKTA